MPLNPSNLCHLSLRPDKSTAKRYQRIWIIISDHLSRVTRSKRRCPVPVDLQTRREKLSKIRDAASVKSRSPVQYGNGHSCSWNLHGEFRDSITTSARSRRSDIAKEGRTIEKADRPAGLPRQGKSSSFWNQLQSFCDRRLSSYLSIIAHSFSSSAIKVQSRGSSHGVSLHSWIAMRNRHRSRGGKKPTGENYVKSKRPGGYSVVIGIPSRLLCTGLDVLAYSRAFFPYHACPALSNWTPASCFETVSYCVFVAIRMVHGAFGYLSVAVWVEMWEDNFTFVSFIGFIIFGRWGVF